MKKRIIFLLRTHVFDVDENLTMHNDPMTTKQRYRTFQAFQLRWNFYYFSNNFDHRSRYNRNWNEKKKQKRNIFDVLNFRRLTFPSDIPRIISVLITAIRSMSMKFFHNFFLSWNRNSRKQCVVPSENEIETSLLK